MTQPCFYTKLSNRGIIKISGKDRYDFLQGLITNDINLLKKGYEGYDYTYKTCKSIYSCLLTPNGKFLYDFFIYEGEYDNGGSELYLDCEGGQRAEELGKLLLMYKLHSDIDVIVIPDSKIFSISGNITPYMLKKIGNTGYYDPRHKSMGLRTWNKSIAEEGTEVISNLPLEKWDINRIKRCIPDGSRDMLPKISTMMESNIDKLNGVSFNKGCYLGQELTARMHYRGLCKKHLCAITGDNLPESGSKLYKNQNRQEELIGEMRSSCGKYGIALLKDEYFNEMAHNNENQAQADYNNESVISAIIYRP